MCWHQADPKWLNTWRPSMSLAAAGEPATGPAITPPPHPCCPAVQAVAKEKRQRVSIQPPALNSPLILTLPHMVATTATALSLGGRVTCHIHMDSVAAPPLTSHCLMTSKDLGYRGQHCLRLRQHGPVWLMGLGVESWRSSTMRCLWEARKAEGTEAGHQLVPHCHLPPLMAPCWLQVLLCNSKGRPGSARPSAGGGSMGWGHRLGW
jgi:hypothetical protein